MVLPKFGILYWDSICSHPICTVQFSDIPCLLCKKSIEKTYLRQSGFAIAIDCTIKVAPFSFCSVQVMPLFRISFRSLRRSDKSSSCSGLRHFWDLGIFEANLNTSQPPGLEIVVGHVQPFSINSSNLQQFTYTYSGLQPLTFILGHVQPFTDLKSRLQPFKALYSHKLPFQPSVVIFLQFPAIISVSHHSFISSFHGLIHSISNGLFCCFSFIIEKVNRIPRLWNSGGRRLRKN